MSHKNEEKKKYEKPVIKRYISGYSGKPLPLQRTGAFNLREIEGIEIEELVREYGSPLFVYSERKIRELYTELKDAFTLRYPRVQIAWSYKTNYLRAICKLYHNLGSWAEVVSPMEYEMAKKLGLKGEEIIFNGPYKPYDSLERAVTDGALINIDNMDELKMLERIAEQIGQPIEAGIRVNMSIDGYAAWDRFGFNIDSQEALRVVKLTRARGNVRVKGLHFHIGTFIMEPSFYGMAIKKVIHFAKILKEEEGIEISYIDIGGGFASRNNLKGSYLPTKELVPPFQRYAEEVCSPLLDSYSADELPLLILETGRALIDEACFLISTVVATKRLPSGQRALILDAGVNLLFTAFWYNHDIIPTTERDYPVEEHVVYGPLCMQIDVVRESIKLPYLERGDRVVITPAGAYNNTQWLQFITLRPNVVMISKGGEVSLIRKAETVEYLQKQETIPSWLQE